MQDEPGINRISLRIPAGLFQRLEEKRFRQRTSFQKVGLELFESWLRIDSDGEMVPQPITDRMTSDERRWVERLLLILRSNDRDIVQVIKLLLRMFSGRSNPNAPPNAPAA